MVSRAPTACAVAILAAAALLAPAAGVEAAAAGMEASVANAPPSLAEGRWVTGVAEGAVAAWAIIEDPNGGADVGNVTFLVATDEGEETVEPDVRRTDGTEVLVAGVAAVAPERVEEVTVTARDAAGASGSWPLPEAGAAAGEIGDAPDAATAGEERTGTEAAAPVGVGMAGLVACLAGVAAVQARRR